MPTKLTLSVAPDVIEAAKRYAAEHGTSVSRLVEDFLASVAAEPDASSPPTPVLKRLRGSLRGVDLDDWRAHQVEKYG